MSARDYADSTVAITGGTSGIGLASAHQLAAAGVRRIALLGRNPERGEAARAAVAAGCPDAQVEFRSLDGGDPVAAESVLADVADRFGGLDVVVNSTAANYRPELLRDIPAADIGAILMAQALPPLVVSRLALPHLAARGGGAIINIASDAAKVPTPGETVIGAAMAAIVTYTRTLAIEAKRDGVRANVLTPSLVDDTPTAQRVLSDGFSRKLFEKARTQAHLGVALPGDLAALVVFLAGPGAAKLTGQAISVNGGISAA